MKNIYKALVIGCSPLLLAAQSAKVQTAYRNLQDYETSKDVSSLMKAKEAIDLAANHEDTKGKAKTWVYRTKIYYDLFENSLMQEEKKFPDEKDKNKRMSKAYGVVATADYEEAGRSLQKAVELDKEKVYQADYAMVGMQMMNDVNNLAVGRFDAQKYKESAQFFEESYEATKLMGKKDTATLSNALLAARRSEDMSKIKYYTDKMISEKVSVAANYRDLYDLQLRSKDTAESLKTLAAGRTAFPNDNDLLNRETDVLIRQGKQQEALANLDKGIAREPKNDVLYTFKGDIYSKLAKVNEKSKTYDDNMKLAEDNYKKAVELNPKNAIAYYNMGTLYNNYGGVWQTRCDDLVKQATKLKECEDKTKEMFNKSVSAFEKALELDPKDKLAMQNLKKLYLITNQPEKSQKMGEQLKK